MVYHWLRTQRVRAAIGAEFVPVSIGLEVLQVLWFEQLGKRPFPEVEHYEATGHSDDDPHYHAYVDADNDSAARGASAGNRGDNPSCCPGDSVRADHVGRADFIEPAHVHGECGPGDVTKLDRTAKQRRRLVAELGSWRPGRELSALPGLYRPDRIFCRAHGVAEEFAGLERQRDFVASGTRIGASGIAAVTNPTFLQTDI